MYRVNYEIYTLDPPLPDKHRLSLPPRDFFFLDPRIKFNLILLEWLLTTSFKDYLVHLCYIDVLQLFRHGNFIFIQDRFKIQYGNFSFYSFFVGSKPRFCRAQTRQWNANTGHLLLLKTPYHWHLLRGCRKVVPLTWNCISYSNIIHVYQ